MFDAILSIILNTTFGAIFDIIVGTIFDAIFNVTIKSWNRYKYQIRLNPILLG